MQTFVEAKNAREARKMITHSCSKIVKVEGGYIGFEYMTDYQVWARAK